VKKLLGKQVQIEYAENDQKVHWWTFLGSSEVIRLPHLKSGKFWRTFLGSLGDETRQWQILDFSFWTTEEMDQWVTDADFIDDLLGNYGDGLIGENDLLSIVRSELFDMINEEISLQKIGSLFWRCRRVKTQEEKRRDLAQKRMQIRRTNAEFQIINKTLTGEIQILDVTKNTTIEAVKEQISDVTLINSKHGAGLHPSQQRLIFNGIQGEDGRTLEEYKIQEGSTIHSVLRLRGDIGVLIHMSKHPVFNF